MVTLVQIRMEIFLLKNLEKEGEKEVIDIWKFFPSHLTLEKTV